MRDMATIDSTTDGNNESGSSRKQDGHRKVISLPYKMDQDEKGTFLFATKDLTPGTILLDEIPILHLLPNQSKPCCFACGKIFIDPNSIRSCSVCTWPICSIDCEQESIHKDHECKFFNTSGIKYRELKAFRRLDMISALIRGITIKKYQPELWNSVLSLGMANVKQEFQIQPCHLDFLYKKLKKVLGSSELDGSLHIGSMLLQLFVQKSLNFKERVYLDTGFSQAEEPTSKNVLYKKASLLDHSCSPNCIIQMGQFPACNIRIRTIVPIAKGEKLTVEKFDILEEGTLGRRTKIYDLTKSICECSRCTSPDESHSYSSAVRCPQCLEDETAQPVKKRKLNQINNSDDNNNDELRNQSYLLPYEDAEMDKGVYALLWQCNHCFKIEHLFSFYHRVGEISNKLREHDPKQNPHVSLEDAKKFCRDLITKYSETLVHPNHWLIQKAHRILVINIQRKKMLPAPRGNPYLRNQEESVTVEEIDEYIKMCDYLLKIQDYVQLGFSEFRDELNKCLFMAIRRKLYLIPHTKQYTLELLGEMKEIAESCYDFHKDSLPLPGKEVNELAMYYSSELKIINEILLPFYNAL